jgi:hypothetical protein
MTHPHLATPVHKLWPPRQIAALIAAYAGGFAASRVVYNTIGGFGGLAIALVCGLVAYAAVFALAGGIGRRDRERVQALLESRRARNATPPQPVGVAS